MSATAKKTAKLHLTSPRKMPKRPAKKVQAQAPATDLKATLEAAVEAVATAAPTVPGLDGDAGTPAEQVGEPVTPRSKPKKAAPKAEPAADTNADVLFGLLSRPERVTPRELMDATGLTHSALKAAVTRLLREKKLRVVLQRNPAVDPQDRALTSYLYTVEKA